jgi:hypothetical protein
VLHTHTHKQTHRIFNHKEEWNCVMYIVSSQSIFYGSRGYYVKRNKPDTEREYHVFSYL